MSDTVHLAAADLLAALAEVDVAALTDPQRIDLLTVLERLKGAAAACQARTVVAFADSQRTSDAYRGVRAEARGRGVAIQVGLAMRQSPARARRFVGFAHAMTELPHTYDALAAGETSEYRAFLVARETMCLSREDRAAVDAELAAGPGGLGALSDRDAEGASRAIAQRLDPAAAVRRSSDAVKARRVSLRAAPDGTCRLSGVLPLPAGVSVFAALSQAADSARAAGDPRARGAVMADELVDRVLSGTAGQEVVVNLVMTDATLLGSDDPTAHHEPAQVVSGDGVHGTLPADTARGLVADAARAWVRRLHADPDSGNLVAMDSGGEYFEGGLRELLVLRDQKCRTPWCDAPVRHADHVVRRRDGGRTSAGNGQGLCEACNQAKEHADLDQRARPDGSIVTTTSTGHEYRSHRPRPPGSPPWSRLDWSVLEHWMLEHAPT